MQETTVLRNTVVNAGFVVKFDVGSKEEGSMESNTIKDDVIHVSLSRVNMKMGKPGKIHFKQTATVDDIKNALVACKPFEIAPTELVKNINVARYE